MTEGTYRFELPTHRRSIIKVIGVGGGGSNAVNSMYNRGIKDVSFVVCNTDAQALESSAVPNKLQIGINLTSGLGAGANPEVGKNAAVESKEDIKKMLGDETRMVFITAGMGGGTGTGAAPVLANVAQKMGILTVGIVTLPFSFEGKKKLERAHAGIQQMREHCDTVLVILNDRLKEILGNLSIGTAFAQADNVLTTAAKSIAEIITVPGYVNVDFEDVKTVMKGAGAAVMGSAVSEGEGRALQAAEEALASPLLDNTDIHGAKKILLSIVSGNEAELQMDELAAITDYIQEQVGADAEIIFGHGSDAQLGESIRVTVIATGFEEERQRKRSEEEGEKTEKKQAKLFEEQQQTKRRGRLTRSKKRATQKTNDLPTTDKEAGKEEIPVHTNGLLFPEESLTYASETIRSTRKRNAAEEQIRKKLEIPAYLRKNISLEETYFEDEEIKKHHLEEPLKKAEE